MKHKVIQCLIFILLTLNSSLLFSQVNNSPAYYLNSKKVEMKNLYINYQNVDSIWVEKIKEKAIYIYTKKRQVNFLSLDDVLKKYSNVTSSGGDVLIRINGEIIDDLSGIRIDDSYFIYVETKRLSETQYIKHELRGLVIVDIALETKKREQRIILRGKNEMFPLEM